MHMNIYTKSNEIYIHTYKLQHIDIANDESNTYSLAYDTESKTKYSNRQTNINKY